MNNKDGSFGWAANVALSAILYRENIYSEVFNEFIGSFEFGGTTYVLCHGKDDNLMSRNMPLTLNIKTENYINEYLDSRSITGKVVFVKGDLHQSATTEGRRFTYKSVSSLFGSSEWIHKNFGNTPWGCDYSLIINGERLDGIIKK